MLYDIKIPGCQVKFRITMLGSFSISIDNAIISDSISNSPKMLNLVAFMIMARSRVVSHSELINLLWPDESVQNPVNALKAVICRIRSSLKPFLGKGICPIVTRNGSYAWNTEYECVVDAEEFDKLCKSAGNDSLDAGERIHLYRKAVDLYIGDFLPKLSDQLWVIPLSVHYHTLYIRTVKDFAALLEKEGLFSEMCDICQRAAGIEAYDEQIHILLMTALERLGNKAAAIEHYKKITDMLYNDLGITPSKDLRDIYGRLMKDRKGMETNLDVIKEDLREDTLQGAFICEYGVFKQLYRLEARRAGREGTCAHIGLITANPADNEPGKEISTALLNKKMDQLLDILRSKLRKGDVILRYSIAQYLVMLMNADFEDSTKVIERVFSSYYRIDRKTPFILNYSIRQVDLAEQDGNLS